MKKLLENQKIRFLLAGSANTLLDFALLNTVTLLFGLDVLVANTISVTVGITLSYLLNHYFVFRHPQRVSVRKFLQFFLVTGFSSLVIQNGIIYLFELLFDTRFGHSLLFLGDSASNHFLAINVAKAFAVFVGLIWNFLMYKFVVFRQSPGIVDDDGIVVEVRQTPV